MRWSRDGIDVPGAASVLRFPSGIQARIMMCEPPDEATLGPQEPENEEPDLLARGQQLGLTPFNVRALVVWNMAGLSLFAGGRRPSLHDVLEEARAVVVALEIEEKADNITRVAEALGTSRRVIREYLRRIGLYDWTRAKGDDEDPADAQEEARVDVEG